MVKPFLSGIHVFLCGWHVWSRVLAWAIFSLSPPPSPGVLLLSPLLVGVKPYNAQTGTTLYIFMTLILLVVVCPMWLTLIRPRKPREATRTWWEFNSSRILHVANPNKLLASQSQSIEPEPEQLYTYIWDWLTHHSSFSQITSNFLTQASWRLYEIK